MAVRVGFLRVLFASVVVVVAPTGVAFSSTTCVHVVEHPSQDVGLYVPEAPNRGNDGISGGRASANDEQDAAALWGKDCGVGDRS